MANLWSVVSPYNARGQIGRGCTIAYATVTFDKQANNLPADAAKALIDDANAAKVPGLKIDLNGPVMANAVQAPMGSDEAVGSIAAVIILFIAFGSFLALSLPILAAITGVGIGAGLIGLLSHGMTVPSFTPYEALMIGLGVGIDYALFITVRYRTGLHDGLDPEAANVLALATAGRAVLFGAPSRPGHPASPPHRGGRARTMTLSSDSLRRK